MLFDLGDRCKVAALQWPETLVRRLCGVCRPACLHVKYAGKLAWTLLLTSTSLSSSLFLSPLFCPRSPCPPPYIVLAIGQSTSGSYSSITGGDPSPLEETGRKPSEYRKAFISFSLYFIPSPSCFHSFSPSLYLSHSLPTPCLCLGRLPRKLRACRTVRRCTALPIVAYANRIIYLAPDCFASLTHLNLAACALYSTGLGWTNTEIWLQRRSLRPVE